MMTQIPGVFQSDEQTIAQLELERDIAAQAHEIAPEKIVNFYYEDLGDSTEQILRYAFWLADVKEHSSKSRYQQILREQGWKGEDKKYLKVAVTFKDFDPAALRYIEPDTIFLLAKSNKKYQPVIDQMKYVEQLDQAVVRELIKKHRKRKPFKSEPNIWRATPRGERYCQIPPIWEDDHFTGVTLQAMIEREGLTAQQIIRESLELRLAYIEGRLVEVQEKIVEEPFLDDFADYEDCETVDEVEPEIEEELFMDELELLEARDVEFDEYQASNSQLTGDVGFGANIVKTVDVQEWEFGWQEGTSVIANSTSQHFQAWCGGQEVKIVSVCGEVGKIQFVTVARDDGETYDSFGDWIQEAATAANVPQMKLGNRAKEFTSRR